MEWAGGAWSWPAYLMCALRPRSTSTASKLGRGVSRAGWNVHHAKMGDGIQDADRLRRLQALTDAALAHLELDALLPTLLLRTREILEVDTCAVLLLDEGTNELVARAAVGLEEEVEQGVRIPVGCGFAGRVAADRRPVILDDVDHGQVLNPILR